MRVLVTGGGGFLGRTLAEQLQARGDRVAIFSRGAYPEITKQGIDVLRGNLTDAGAVTKAIEGFDVVFHVAAVPGIWGSWNKYYSTNTLGTLNVIQACQQHGVQRLIYTSSPSVVYDGQAHLDADESLPYPDSYLCHYPHSKALAEKAVLEAHKPGTLSTVSLRPHLIWGPRDNHLIPRLVQRAIRCKLRRVGDGSNLVSMSYVENAATAHLQAEEELRGQGRCGGKAYFINEPEPVRLWDWINEILALGGLPPITQSISARMAYAIGSVCETVYTVLRKQDEPPMTRFLASQLSQSHTYSVAAAQRDFGYSPAISYQEAMQRLRPLVEQCVKGEIR